MLILSSFFYVGPLKEYIFSGHLLCPVFNHHYTLHSQVVPYKPDKSDLASCNVNYYSLWPGRLSQRMPHHPRGDQKLLQLETLLDTDQGPPKSTKEMLYHQKIKNVILKISPENFSSQKIK